MQSNAPDVATYLVQAPAARQECLHRLRNLCVQTLVGYAEMMAFGMPGYGRRGVIEVGFASQKNYISLYILNQTVLNAHRDALVGISVGKGCIRYPKPEKMDFAVIEQLLAAIYESSAAIC